jgi:hypothetical protein
MAARRGGRRRPLIACGFAAIALLLGACHVPTPPAPPTTTTKPPVTTTTATPPPTTTSPTTSTVPPTTTTSPPPTTTTSATPTPGDFPTADDTGATGPLTDVTPASGEQIVDGTGTVFSDKRIHGTLTVLGCGVTIRNVEVDAGVKLASPVNSTPDVFAIWNKADEKCTTTLDHVTVSTPAGRYATEAVRDSFGSTQHITSLKAIGQQLGITVGGGDVIQDSYVELAPTLRGDHNEDVLDDGTTGLTIEHNTMLNPNGQTSVLSLFTEFGSNHSILVRDNLLAGGGYTCYCGDGASDNSGKPAPADNVSFMDNVFWRLYFPNVGEFAPGRAYNPAGGGRWTGNVFMDANRTLTSQLVPQPPLDGK